MTVTSYTFTVAMIFISECCMNASESIYKANRGNGLLEEKILLLADHDVHSQMAGWVNIRHFYINHPEIVVALSGFGLQ